MLDYVQSDNDASLCRENFTTRISEFLSSERLELTWLPRLIILSHVSPLLHQKLRKHWSLKCVYLQICDLYIAIIEKVVGSLNLCIKYTIYYSSILWFTHLLSGGQVVPPSPSNLVSLLSQNLLAVEAKVSRLLVGVFAQLSGQSHVSAVSNHGCSSVTCRRFCSKVNWLQSQKSGQEVDLVCMMPQCRPHSK